LLKKPKSIDKNIIIIVEDLQNEIKLLNQGIHEIHKLQSYPYVSFTPVNEVVALSLNGFKYNLHKQPRPQGSTLTLS
ncbi:thiamine diphosphokinase, partial [Staphylococcus sp. SIMBA_130]